MSYRVLCDGYVLHDSNLEQFTLINPVLTVELNKSGEFTFQIANNHVYYDKIINKNHVLISIRMANGCGQEDRSELTQHLS